MFQLQNWERSATARITTAIGGLAFLTFSIGCMNLSFGGRHEYASSSTPDSEITQNGTAAVRHGDEVAVYYPTPFQSTPNLQFSDAASRNDVTVTEQAADHFRMKNMSASNVSVSWEARGVKVVAVVPAVNAAPPTTTATAQPVGRNP